MRTKDDLVNGIFEIVSKDVKPAEILVFANLFNDRDFKDAVTVLQKIHFSQSQRSNRSFGGTQDVQQKVKNAL